MIYDLRQDHMDTGIFHCSQVAESILRTVIGCWPSEPVYQCVHTLTCLRCYGLGIELAPIYFLFASWTPAGAVEPVSVVVLVVYSAC